MFGFRRLRASALLLAGLATFVSAQESFSRLISSDAIHEYRQAVSEARHGRSPIAEAILESLVLERPVRIGIEDSGLPYSFGNDYAEGVAKAIRAWCGALSSFPFKIVHDGEAADVTVRFVRNISRGGDEQGLVNVRRHFSWNGNSHEYKIFGDIQIRDVAFGRRLTGEEVGQIAAHEFGHILGLRDDYEGPGVMSAFRENGGTLHPSREEIEAVSQFQEHVRTVLRQAREE